MNTANLSISTILNDAWELTNGSKWALWLATLAIGISAFIVNWLITVIFKTDPQVPPFYYRFLIMPIVNNMVIAPFYAGAAMTAINRARGKTITWKSGFRYFRYILPLMATMAIIAFLSNLVAFVVHTPMVAMELYRVNILLNIISIAAMLFVYVATIFSIPLIADKNYGIKKALLTSFEIVKIHWLKVLVLLLIVYAFFIIATLPLYIGALIHPYAKLLGLAILIAALIWLIPYMFLVQGVLYHKLVDSHLSQEMPPY